MGGIMWMLRWLAAGMILVNCALLPIDASLEAAAAGEKYREPLVVQHEIRWERS